MTDEQLIALYQEMADLTRPICARCTPPRPPFQCCSALYCWTAQAHARARWNVQLTRTGNETLPYMGEGGCIVAPHLRSLCTIAVCKDELALQPEGVQERYWTLRAAIEAAEAKRG
jgi:hypothetical protein